MHADIAAGQGKGIQGGVAQGEELEVLARLGGGCGQAGAECIQIGGNLDIVDVGRLALTNIAHDRLANAPLHLRREIGSGSFAQIGQAFGKNTGRQRGEKNQGSESHCLYDTLSAPGHFSRDSAKLAKKSRSLQPEKVLLSTHTLLLAEDSPEDTRLILNALHPVIQEDMVALCGDGVEALDYLLARNAYAHRSGDDLPGVALLDLNLPKINGLEVLRELRENPRTRLLPVVILSASSEQRDVRAASLLGANSYVRKPLDYGRLRETVELLGHYWLDLNISPPPAPPA